MREGTATLVRREDYAAPAYWIRSVELSFDLDPAKTIVASRLQVERNRDRPAQPLRLHGEGLKLLRVQADGDSVSFREEDGTLVIDNPPDAAQLHARHPQHHRAREEQRTVRACTPAAAASSRSARPRASAASPTSSTGPT